MKQFINFVFFNMILKCDCRMFLLFGVDHQSDSVQRHVGKVPGSVSRSHLLRFDSDDERKLEN